MTEKELVDKMKAAVMYYEKIDEYLGDIEVLARYYENPTSTQKDRASREMLYKKWWLDNYIREYNRLIGDIKDNINDVC